MIYLVKTIHHMNFNQSDNGGRRCIHLFPFFLLLPSGIASFNHIRVMTAEAGVQNEEKLKSAGGYLITLSSN